MKKCQIIFTCLLAFLSMRPSQGGVPYSPPSESGETRHVGSEFSLPDSEKKSTIIFIGKLEVLGIYDLTASGVMAYHNTKIKIISSLKGKLIVGDELSVTISPSLVPKKGWEATPIVGDTYIFFVKMGGNEYIAVKLVKANDDNIAKVKALIAK